MFDTSNILLVLLCLYYQEGKKLGEDTVRIGSDTFRLVVSDDPIDEVPGVLTFRISPLSVFYKYLEARKDNE